MAALGAAGALSGCGKQEQQETPQRTVEETPSSEAPKIEEALQELQTSNKELEEDIIELKERLDEIRASEENENKVEEDEGNAEIVNEEEESGPQQESGEETDQEKKIFEEGLIKITGAPDESFPVRWGNGVVQSENTTEIEDSWAWMIADPGVYGFDHYAPEHDNPSAVWHGGANVDNLMENETGTYLVPEGGYIKITLPQAIIEGGDMKFEIEDRADTAVIFLARGLYKEENQDRHLPLEINTEHPGRVKVMRYPVPAEAGGFFSEEHLMEDITSSHEIDNRGEGGAQVTYVVLTDYNHGTVGIYRHKRDAEVELIYTNAVKPNQEEINE
jgi:hypothetical protein